MIDNIAFLLFCRRNCWPIFNRILRGGTIKTVILDVREPKEAMTGFARVWHANQQQEADRISFAIPELLWKVLTACWELLKTLYGAGPVSIREAARRVARDVKGAHGGVTALWKRDCSIAPKAAQLNFPYEAIKVEFLLQAA